MTQFVKKKGHTPPFRVRGSQSGTYYKGGNLQIIIFAYWNRTIA